MKKTHEFHLKSAARKPLIYAIEDFAGVRGIYQGAPTFGYDFGIGVLDKNGALHFDCSPKVITKCITRLEERGFTCDNASEETAEPEVPYFPEQPHEDWENCAEDFREIDGLPSKKKGIMDTLIDELNANAGEGESWERQHRPPTVIDSSGREHNLDGAFASTAPAFEALHLSESEELGLGQERRDPVGEDGMLPSNVPETITIEVPFTGDGEILRALLQSKASLIAAALGEDAWWSCPETENSPENPGGWYGPVPADNTLLLEFEDGKAKFEWLRFGTDSEVVTAWGAFLCAAAKFAKTAKRVTAKEKAVESEKFAFRTFMVKLGMNDAENKNFRKTLMRKLKGDAAFATVASKEKWLAKHGSKKNTEVKGDEAAE